ncbi:MAG: RluA family pseudouridine synthase [Rhabdochlamydiaceae bacterium]|nr:RluA family pseudouridine synthase [Candidatus Amphrikana amoebophyrae]
MKLLDQLTVTYPESSKTQLKKWVLQGRISIDGIVCTKPQEEINPDQTISLDDKKEFARCDLKIMYKDDSVIVVEKPPGLLSVAHDTKLIDNCHSVLKRMVAPARVYPVHRLDRETSGILVFALTEQARDHLKEQFFAHSIHRLYRALVEGEFEQDKGEWRSYLTENKLLFVYSSPFQKEGSKLAITHYEVVNVGMGFSEVYFKLETGRKNQIRAQCLANGHPIAGDKKYGAKTNPIKRLALHAEELEFTHPKTGKRKKFESKPSFDLFLQVL